MEFLSDSSAPLTGFETKKHMGVSKNRGTPKSSILIGFSIINHPFWGTPIFGNTHISAQIMIVRIFFAHSSESAFHTAFRL